VDYPVRFARGQQCAPLPQADALDFCRQAAQFAPSTYSPPARLTDPDHPENICLLETQIN